jgi:2-oxoglutarate ferredoxin oxidoreductase subunit beta
VREHNEAVNRLDFMPDRVPITTDYPEGGVRDVVLHDGSAVRLRKLDATYDPSDKVSAMSYLESRRAQGEVVTGLLYVDADSADMHASLRTVDAPLYTLGVAELIPGHGALAAINASLR